MSAKLIVCTVLAVMSLGVALDPTTLLSDISLSQLKTVLASLTQSQSGGCDKARGIAVKDNCLDDSMTEDCGLVVERELCNKKPHFARFCCRSCTLAGQIPFAGPHIESEEKAPLTVKFEAGNDFQKGANVTLTCIASGYPTPGIVWFLNGKAMNDQSEYLEYEEKVSELGGVLIKEVKSELTLKNFEGNYTNKVECKGLNQVSHVGKEKQIKLRDTVLEMKPWRPIFQTSDEKVLECIATGHTPYDIKWKVAWYLRNNYTTTKEERLENGLKIVTSRLTLDLVDLGNYHISCEAFYEGGSVDAAKRVYVVSDVSVPEGCEDAVPTSACIDSRQRCNKTSVAALCCWTCTIFGDGDSDYLARDLLYVSLYDEGTFNQISYGANTKLTCFSSSNVGNVTVRWLKNGERIENPNKYIIEDEFKFEAIRWSVQSMLTIRHVTVSDMGNYTCQAFSDEDQGAQSKTLTFTTRGKAAFRYSSYRP